MTYKEQQEKWEQDNLCKKAKKSSKAKRWKADEDDIYRTEYQRDVGRILLSDAFRRLRMKTQVFVASGLDQHNRTRLTHSLEVSQIARSIARPLLLNEDLTEAIALGHDLGHTPFGHAGEKALNDCLKSRNGFNHNVQSVRILRAYPFQRRDRDNALYSGLNLTHDVVEGVWKHTKYKHTLGEYGDLKYYSPEKSSSLEGQVVDIADGVAYVRHDAEDAIRERLLRFGDIESVWKANTDIKFDRHTWSHYFIYDVINNSANKNTIGFSKDMDKLFAEIKKLIDKKVLKSDRVKSMDNECREKICMLYHYFLQRPDKILKKFQSWNTYLMRTEGVERVVANYIQWLGDEIAGVTYDKIQAGVDL